MLRLFVTTLLLACVFWLGTSPKLVAAEAELLPPTDAWSGKLANESLAGLAPADHLITSAPAFEKLWKAWRSEEDPPKIDFATDLVLVATLPGPNRVLIKPWLSADGNLHLKIMGTKLPGPGCGYSIWRLSRAGVRTLEGQPLP